MKTSIARIVGFLVCVEIASGILQGYYTPLYSDIARNLNLHDADVNWFEAFQLIVSALTVPLLARLGDLYGHKKVLLGSTLITALASWGVAFAGSFETFLIAWSLQGFYVVWLPMEVAIIYRRTKGNESRTRAAAGLLVFALEAGVIAGALSAGALAESLGMTALLSVPAIATTLALFAIWFGVEETERVAHGRIDWIGFGAITALLAFLMAGLVALRLEGLTSLLAWGLLALTAVLVVPYVRHQLNHQDPLIDLRVMSSAGQWQVQAMAFLFGMSVLGAQIPLSTFARTDPAAVGYGLGASAATVSLLIGGYVLALAVGALLLTNLGRVLGTRNTMIGAGALVATGYLLFLPFHDTVIQTLTNMVIAGLGSGGLVALLPAAAAAAAPASHTGQTTGMTNTIKTVGGAIASSIYALALMGPTGQDFVAPLAGYLVVWGVCGVSALLGSAVLLTARPINQQPDRSPHMS